MTDLAVNAIFGPTIQGEGPFTGRSCVFLRLGRCNLDCSWCDTPYTWDWKGKNGTVYDPAVEVRSMTVEEVVAALVARGLQSLLIVSGGEPLLQRGGLTQLIPLLPQGVAVQIETNGTRPPLDVPGVHYVASPKLANSGVSADKAIRIDVLSTLAERGAHLKVVCASTDDVDTVLDLAALTGFPLDRTWIMPEGRSVEELHHRRDVVDYAVERGCNVSGRAHVDWWGDERDK